jgi:activator of HSP90 ATPase
MAQLPPSTANWHWKNKNVTRWGRDWFERELTAIIITGESEGEQVSVSKVTTVEGDIELGQRKSKYVVVDSFSCSVLLTRAVDSSPSTTVESIWNGPESPATGNLSPERSRYPRFLMRSLSMVYPSIP